MNIGNISFRDKPLFLAPMEDVTDASFRYVCKMYGADMLYTEFVSSDGLIRDVAGSLKKLEIFDARSHIYKPRAHHNIIALIGQRHNNSSFVYIHYPAF